MKEIYLVRHGETFFNLLTLAQGCADSPLTKRGKEEAERLGIALKEKNTHFDAAYTSDLTRAKDTAKLILTYSKLADQINLVETTKLREVAFGSFEGMNSHEMWNKSGTALNMPHFNSDYPDWKKIYVLEGLKKLDIFHAAEDYGDLKKRISRLINLLLSSSHNSILAVSHGLFISTIVYLLSSEQIKVDVIPNTSVTKINYDGIDFDIEYVGRKF